VKGEMDIEANAQIHINVVFVGFPRIYDFFHSNRIRHPLPGKTVTDLVEDLVSRHGETIRKSLLEESTKRLDPTLQVRLNGTRVKREEFDRQTLQAGDTLTFLRLLAGG
jgi:sulfur carrier protein ThiS